MVKVPGGFLERQDALLCGIWLVSIFAFVENALYYAVWCLKKMSRKNENGRLLPGVGVFVYALALCMYRSERFALRLTRVYARTAVPVLVGIVLVAYILSVWRGKKIPARKNTTLSGKKTGCREEKR